MRCDEVGTAEVIRDIDIYHKHAKYRFVLLMADSSATMCDAMMCEHGRLDDTGCSSHAAKSLSM